MYTKASVPGRIYARRKELDLTQTKLAELLSSNREQVSKWERGIVCPDTDTLLNLSNALDCDLEYLLGGIDSPRHDIHDATETTGLSRESVQILFLLKNSPSYQAKTKLEIIDKILKSDIFVRDVLPRLVSAKLALSGNASSTDPELESAKDAIELYNLGGNTRYAVYSGADSAALQIQIAANETQFLYKAIVNSGAASAKKSKGKAKK